MILIDVEEIGWDEEKKERTNKMNSVHRTRWVDTHETGKNCVYIYCVCMLDRRERKEIEIEREGEREKGRENDDFSDDSYNKITV